MQAYKRNHTVNRHRVCVFLYTDEGSSVTLQMCSLTRDAPELALFALLRVFPPFFQIGPKNINLMRLFVRYDTLQ